MPLLARADYDAALADAVDDLPQWALEALGDGIIRVEQTPRPGGLMTEAGLRVVVYREPSISQAADLAELRRLARTDLVRAIVWQLDLGDADSRALAAIAG
jgi:hypothetical protein